MECPECGSNKMKRVGESDIYDCQDCRTSHVISEKLGKGEADA